MMRADAEGLRRKLVERLLDSQYRLARRQPRSIADAENMGIDSERLGPERCVHHHVCSLSPDTGQSLKRGPVGGHHPSMLAHQNPGQRDDVFRLAVEQSNGLDMLFQRVFTQRHHLRRRLDLGEQRPCGLVDPYIGRLRRAHHRNQQLVDIAIGKLRLRRRVRLRQPPVKFEDVCFFQRPSPVTCATWRVSAYCWNFKALPPSIHQI